MEVEKCADAEAVTVKSEDFNSITYNITAGEGQEDYLYMVYLDDVKEIGTAVLAGQDYTVTTNEGGIDAGSYDVILTLKDPDHYHWSDDNRGRDVTKTLKFNITQAENEWTSDLAIESWKYGEEAKAPTISAKFGEAVYTYSASEDGDYTADVPENAGTYYVKAEVAETNNYKGLDAVTTSFAIEKADQDAPEGMDTVKSTLEENADGKITNVTDAMEYRAEDATEYTAIEGTEIADVLAGKYYVRYKEI